MYQQLSAWLLHGQLTDIHSEFFVTEITDKDESDSPVEQSQKAIDSGTDLGIPGITGKQLAEIIVSKILNLTVTVLRMDTVIPLLNQ